MGAFISAAPDYLNIENIIFLLQNCIVRREYLIKKIDKCDTSLKHLSRNEMPFQTVFNKMSLDPMTDALKDWKKNNAQENNSYKNSNNALEKRNLQKLK